ncbi:MAG TPA: MgtC/SapB family protein [Burkholderiales bacterium]|jgi:putative Mg2+ transporter-C (MgtC) family protein
MNIDSDYFEICLRLVAALAAGGIIGLERSYRGRAAGFRTHALVCVASSLLMLVTMFQSHWIAGIAVTRVVIDPTRLAQGIMTGIGFLGAGVIVKEGLTVRGLTTAASIWITAAIGILIGMGFYFPAGIGTVLTLGTLSVFRWIEGKIPSEFYANFLVRFPREQAMPEAELRRLIAEHGFDIANMSYRIAGQGREFEYQMVLRTLHAANAQTFSARLVSEPSVTEFRIAPAGD